ncbi:CD276 antigen-like isoform X1 [Arapaima gigas]
MISAQVWLCTLLWVSGLAQVKRNPEVQVTTCIIFEDCVLPCRFQPGAANSVSWYRREVPFLSSSDQSVRHDRASLFTEKVPEGDASLLLRGSTFQDRGKYRCHVNGTAGERDSVVLLRVKAPIRFVSLEMAQSKMTQLNCSSQNIYPAPHLRWFTDPPSPPWLLRPVTRMEANGKGLYFVQSSLTVVGSLADYTYICVVNASYGTQTWRASLREKEDVTGIAGQPLTIPCLAPRDLTNFTLTWTFLREQRPSTILTYSSYTGLMTNSWSDQAEVDGIQARSGNGSIRLWKLRNEENAGLYTCTFSAFQMSHTVLTRVSITGAVMGMNLLRLWIVAIICNCFFSSSSIFCSLASSWDFCRSRDEAYKGHNESLTVEHTWISSFVPKGAGSDPSDSVVKHSAAQRGGNGTVR